MPLSLRTLYQPDIKTPWEPGSNRLRSRLGSALSESTLVSKCTSRRMPALTDPSLSLHRPFPPGLETWSRIEPVLRLAGPLRGTPRTGGPFAVATPRVSVSLSVSRPTSTPAHCPTGGSHHLIAPTNSAPAPGTSSTAAFNHTGRRITQPTNFKSFRHSPPHHGSGATIKDITKCLPNQ